MIRRTRRRGANVIEFALTLPVFLLMIFGLIEFGYFFGRQAVLDVAILEGTRAGAIVDPATGADLEAIAEARIAEIASLMGGGSCSYDCIDQVVDLVLPDDDYALRELVCDARCDTPGLIGMVPLPDVVRSRGRQLLEWQR